MYHHIRGRVTQIESGLVVLEAGGVGYALNTSMTSIGAVGMGDEATFYTWLYVREDIFDLYGFYTAEELRCFKLLIGVSGVGPKAALSVLGVVTPAKLANAVLAEDVAALSAAPGVGKKLAARMVMELKDKMGLDWSSAGYDSYPGAVPVGAEQSNAGEALEALLALGFTRGQALTEMGKLKEKDLPADEIIRQVLKAQ